MVNPPGPKFDYVYGHEVAKLSAEHIVPLRDIYDMPGFQALPKEKWVAIANMPANFIGLDLPVNESRGRRPWGEWPGHPRFGPVPPEVRRELAPKQETNKGTS